LRRYLDSKDLKIKVTSLMKKMYSRERFQLEMSLSLGKEGLYEKADGSPVSIDLLLESSPDGIRVRGHIGGRLTLECTRCLELYQHVIDIPVDEFYCKPTLPLLIGGEREEEVEIPREESYILDGEMADLNQLINDLVMLSIPMKHLCDEGCKGLCPFCGINLNQERCECREEHVDPRLEKLKQWLDREQG
jgi:uncharacterized protein